MLATAAQVAAGISLATLLTTGSALAAPPKAPPLGEPRIKSISATQTFSPGTNDYLVETTLRWKAVKAANVYQVCSQVDGARTTCATGIQETTYTNSINGVPAGTTLTYYVIACITTGPVPVCNQSQPRDITVGG